MSEITVLRYPSEPDWTLSEFNIEGYKRIPAGFGVEDEKRDTKVYGETRIDNGIYEIDLVESANFSKEFFVDKDGIISQIKSERFNKPHLCIMVKNVKNFSGVLWHWGNTDLDTKGCYCVGSYIAPFKTKDGKVRQGVAASKAKYSEVYPLIYKIIADNKRAGKKTYVEYKDKAIV